MKKTRQTAFRFSPETEKQLLELALAESTKKGKQITLADIVRELISKAHKRLK